MQQQGFSQDGAGNVPMGGGTRFRKLNEADAAAKQKPVKKPVRRVLTSLTLQILIFFSIWWNCFYYVLNILVFVYKGLVLPYPQQNFDMEFSFAWLYIILEIPRLFLVTKGNKAEQVIPIIFSLVLALPLLAMYAYFIDFQTYVLKVDLILNGIALGFIGLQVLLSIFAAYRFATATRFI
ncbi:hypothetical protein DUNSADRAFT_1042 [Dunaliella salina]|uniref:Transmembrane protein n=1 Tax=Dunaliella salina TaxID=3046 RepID=A0ABQ7GXS4_DUNSA|nr:hypothetical protein DUNSADRAFT_1042 [Dunaliella salina]|eukprot:KAF5839358.1 hypothetical protein DUNSADRAFT_1042 [Dunaliella salina]